MEMIKSYNNQELIKLFRNKVDYIDIDELCNSFLIGGDEDEITNN